MSEPINTKLQGDSNDTRTLISKLSVQQINELYDLLYPIRSLFNDIDLADLSNISSGKINLPVVDQILVLLEKIEKMSQKETVSDQNVQSLLSAFSVADLLNILRNEQVRYDTYKGMSDDDLMPY